MSEQHSSPTGVLPVLQMSFRDDESLDLRTLRKEIDWLLENGVDGLVVAMVSEVLRLDDEERRTVAEVVCTSTTDRVPAIISVGAETTRKAVELTRHAADFGAAAVMAIPPVSIAVQENELAVYYEQIVEASMLPVIVQDASGYVGRPLSIDFQVSLLERFGDDRILFKPEAIPIGQRLSQLRDASNHRARVYEGTGGIALVDSFRRGIIGTMPGADLSRGIVALWQALQSGHDDQVYRLSLPVSSIVALQHSLDAFLAIEKHLLVRQGVFQNTVVRGPRGYVLDRETQAEVDRLFNLLNAALEET